MAAVCHLAFVVCLHDHPRSIVGGLYLYCCAKFGSNQPCSFEHMRFLMLCEFGLHMCIHASFGSNLVKIEENLNFLQYCPSRNATTLDVQWIKQHRNRFCGLVSGSRKKQKACKSNIWLNCRGTPTGSIALNFGMLGYIADVITRANFCDNQFWVSELWTYDTPNFAILHSNSWSPLQQCKHCCATLWWLVASEYILVILYWFQFYSVKF